MKRLSLWLILVAMVGLPLSAFGADEAAPSPAALKAALEIAGTDAETQEELKELYEADSKSAAYGSADTPVAEEVEVEVAGAKQKVTVYREQTDIEKHQLYGNVLWTAVAAFLVFFMQAGFAMVEAGFTRAKNSVNIIMKNVMDFSVGIIAFFIIGFHLMFSGGSESLFFLGSTEAADWGMTFFIFQAVFCATAATIVSGAMAERTKFVSYLVYSAIISAIVYPISGSWAWGSLLDGEGWLETFYALDMPNGETYSVFFSDFAGSTVVHSVGGWLALAGAIVLGPRIGKYGPDGKPRAIMGHNIPLAALGVFILFFGWFGFNPGSTTTFDMSLGGIAVTTGLAAGAGGILAMFTSWIISKKPDGSMTLNGVLAGLVAITAPCATVTPAFAVVIGAIGGVLVVLAVIFIDSVLKVDDPVGAVAVHGVCGAWGTLAAGLFNTPVEAWEGGPMIGGILVGGTIDQLIVQLVGIVTVFAYAFGAGLIMFLAIKFTIGLRVSEEEELRGLDVGEHGMEAYTGFQIFTTT